MSSNYLVLDLETDGLDWQKDPIIAIGWISNDERTIPGIPNSMYRGEFGFDNPSIIKSTDTLVGHNIKFDLLFMWDGLTELFQRGLRIWDTQTVEYMLSGQQDKMPKLRDIAVNKYGCPNRIKWIDYLLFDKKTTILGLKKDLGEVQEKLTLKQVVIEDEIAKIESYKKVSDLPKDKVLEDVRNDVLDTEQVYLGQLKKIEQMHPYFKILVELEMDSLLATCECTYNGMKANRSILENNRSTLKDELKQKETKLNQIVSKYWHDNSN